MDIKIKENIKEIFYLYKLKKTLRWGRYNNSCDTESVAEHIYGMMILINHFLPIIDFEEKMDRKKIYELALFHDIDEIETGDINTYSKTDLDRQKAQNSLEKIFINIPKTFSKKIEKSYFEYENNESDESKFVKAIDKLEPVFHAAFDHDTFYKGFQKIDVDLNYIKKDKIKMVNDFSKMLEYINPLFKIIEENLREEKKKKK